MAAEDDASSSSSGSFPVGPEGQITRTAEALLDRGVDLRGLLDAMLSTICGVLEAERGTIYLVDGSARKLSSVVADLPELERIELDIGQGIAGSVAATGELINLDDPSSDPRFESRFDLATGFRTRSMLVLPVHDEANEIIGVLQLLNAASGQFSPRDIRRARELAVQTGRVLEQTSLYVALRRSGPLEGRRPALAFAFNEIVGESASMRQVYKMVRKAAATDAAVLLTGESGTGKELIARAIHVNSDRRDGPFVKVDCTTLPDALVENELFGHERGAFTGADRTMPGKIEAAHGGTLLIDEIGDLPLPSQGKLLRVLQDRSFERLGSVKALRADVRVICATHRNLAEMVDAGEFREDLFYRVRVVPVQLPPLRERGDEDLLRLVQHFVEKHGRHHGRRISKVTPSAMERLRAHDFPGNIRELENCLESAVVLCDGEVIDANDLPLATRRADALAFGSLGDPNTPLAQLERRHVEMVLGACGGNRSEAARRLGIGRNTLARKLSGES
jgi:Nif-specific regulatory protein